MLRACYGRVKRMLRGAPRPVVPPGAKEQGTRSQEPGARNQEAAAEAPLLCMAGGRSFALRPRLLLPSRLRMTGTYHRVETAAHPDGGRAHVIMSADDEGRPPRH